MAPVMTGRGEISPCDQGRLLNVDNFTDPLANDDTRLCFDICVHLLECITFPNSFISAKTSLLDLGRLSANDCIM